MGLKEYQRKRHFDATPEPAGAGKKRKAGDLFVIQKHAASRLHYDFRLELDGVLKSWAVPKGPSLDPAQRSLAVEVEDHPVEYGSFEGTIPEGQYGAGTVLLWDRGHWKPIGDARQGYRDGRLKFELHGEKLRGIWNLVRMAPRAGRKAEWLLIKHRDEFARPASEYSITEAESLSVASGRDLEEIASGKSKVWQSHRAARRTKRPTKAENRKRNPANRRQRVDLEAVPGAKRAAQPDFVAPQLATLVSSVPEGDDWLHELKLDGYRIVCVLRAGSARLLSRRSNDWTLRFPQIARAVESLPVKNAIIDGEVVALTKAGASDFQALQNVLKSPGAARLAYFVFDIMHCEGYDLMKSPLIERRKLLVTLLSGAGDKRRLRFSEHIVGRGPEVLRQVCRRGLEGVVSKRADGIYESRRSTSWLKIKCKSGQEFVIGGFTDPSGTRTAFGALLVGYYAPDGKLKYAGRVGTGFNETSLSQLGARLRKLEIDKSPFADAPRQRGWHWVRPELVAQVEYTQFTRNGKIRHPAFKGLREDKSPREVVLEQPEVATGESAEMQPPARPRRRPRR